MASTTIYFSLEEINELIKGNQIHFSLNDASKFSLIGVELEKDSDVEKISDGYHDFESLYYQRLVLFATLVNSNKNISWKSKRHEDGEECFGGGWFLVTINTPEGQYGYHYENKYWDMFDCKELDVAEHWDGYTDQDVSRLLSLVKEK